jgi:hypothetical protein
MTSYCIIALALVALAALVVYFICANSSRISRERERHGLE